MKRENLERVEESAAPPKPRPILFSGEMVRAILEGRKTQTRRVIRFAQCPNESDSHNVWKCWNGSPSKGNWSHQWQDGDFVIKCPYGQQSDRLYVRETFAMECSVDGNEPPFKDGRPVKREYPGQDGEYWLQPHYRATDDVPDLECGHNKCEGGPCENPWQPSIHMPRWASRLTLEITKVRVERVQDISAADCEAEGISREPFQRLQHNPMRTDYRILWDKINLKRGFGWDANPWVWVIEFKQFLEVGNAG